MESFGFMCIGLECETPEEAWETFKSEANRLFKWTRGFKVWRAIPELFSDIRFSENKTIYLVKARVLALEEPLDGFNEANINGPYESYFKEPEAEAYCLNTLELEK